MTVTSTSLQWEAATCNAMFQTAHWVQPWSVTMHGTSQAACRRQAPLTAAAPGRRGQRCPAPRWGTPPEQCGAGNAAAFSSHFGRL